MSSRPGMMDRFAVGIGYTSANIIAFDIIKRAGYELLKRGDPITVVDPDEAARFPHLPLVAKFFTTSEMTWTNAECTLIATELALLLDEVRAQVEDDVQEEEAEEAAWGDEETMTLNWVDTFEDDAAKRAEHADRVDRKLNDLVSGELMLLDIFKEAVFRGGEVETN